MVDGEWSPVSNSIEGEGGSKAGDYDQPAPSTIWSSLATRATKTTRSIRRMRRTRGTMFIGDTWHIGTSVAFFLSRITSIAETFPLVKSILASSSWISPSFLLLLPQETPLLLHFGFTGDLSYAEKSTLLLRYEIALQRLLNPRKPCQ